MVTVGSQNRLTNPNSYPGNNDSWRRIPKMKKSLYKWFLLLALVVPLALAACGQDLEQAVEDAARQVEEAATQVAPVPPKP
jgi:predicted small lipoprotein YifL